MFELVAPSVLIVNDFDPFEKKFATSYMYLNVAVL